MSVKYFPIVLGAIANAQGLGDLGGVGGNLPVSDVGNVVTTVLGLGGVPVPTTVLGEVVSTVLDLGDVPVPTTVLGEVVSTVLGLGDVPVPTTVLGEVVSTVLGLGDVPVPTTVLGEVVSTVLGLGDVPVPTTVLGELTSALSEVPVSVPTNVGGIGGMVTSLIADGTDPGAIISDLTSMIPPGATGAVGELTSEIAQITSQLSGDPVVGELTSIVDQATSIILGDDETTVTSATATSLSIISGTTLTSVSAGLDGTQTFLSTVTPTFVPITLDTTTTGSNIPDVTNPIVGTTLTSLTAIATATPTFGAPVPTAVNDNALFGYTGCYGAYSLGSPALDAGSFFQREDLTVEMCNGLCSSSNVFGLIAGQGCFCGAVSASENRIDDAICAAPCQGNDRQACGSITAFSVYTVKGRAANQKRQLGRARTDPETFSTNQAVGFQYNGCYTIDEEDTDAAPAPADGIYESSMQLTPDSCATYCEGYSYFGLYFGETCLCANDLGARTQVPLQDTPSFCNVECTGANDTICGGGTHLSVYSRVEMDIPENNNTAPGATSTVTVIQPQNTVTATVTVGAGAPVTTTVFAGTPVTTTVFAGAPVTTTVFAPTQTVFLKPDGSVAGTSSGSGAASGSGSNPGSGSYGGSGSGSGRSGSGSNGGSGSGAAPGSGAGAPLPTVTVTINHCV